MAQHDHDLNGAPAAAAAHATSVRSPVRPAAVHSAATHSAAVRVAGLTRSFGPRRVLDGIDLTIGGGEFTALLGRSGSGKSTLLRAVAGLDHTTAGSGEVLVPRRVSLVFQDSRLLPWLKVHDNVVLGLRARNAKERGRAALVEVGLAKRESAWPRELSGGEQQRAALARSLVSEPELLLADEPFGALDALTRIRMHRLLRRLYETHRPAVLLVTHDVDEAVTLADRVLVLDDGAFTLDLRIDLPAERDPGDPRFQHFRTTLLGALGALPSHRAKDHT